MAGPTGNSRQPVSRPRRSPTSGLPSRSAYRRRPAVAAEPQSLDSIPLIRRKRGGEGEAEAASTAPMAAIRPQSAAGPVATQEDASALRMKPRDTLQLAAVHVRIPEHLARGLKLM